jgi:hypothetical protein
MMHGPEKSDLAIIVRLRGVRGNSHPYRDTTFAALHESAVGTKGAYSYVPVRTVFE